MSNDTPAIGSGAEARSQLRVPKTPFQKLVRELAIAGQRTLYHDIDEGMPEYWHGVAYLEPEFSRILRGKVK